MAVEISLSQDEVRRIEARLNSGATSDAESEDDRLASFLVNKYRAAEAEESSDSDPNWIFNIWTHRI